MTESKTALITGVGGQDGSYLAELLLSKGYDVYGLIRRSSQPRLDNIYHLLDRIHLLYGDLTDSPSLFTAIRDIQPDEVYNLAAMSFVGSSWTHPVSTVDINTCGVIRLLEAVRHEKKDCRVYHASTSEMYGNQGGVLNEDSPFAPRSPYGISKVAAHHVVSNYRDSYHMYCCAGIAFNHESPRRGIEFVTRKITDGVARIRAGKQDTIKLGNIAARRDWGFAGNYVYAMWLMLQQDQPRDYVIATGETHSVYNFYSLACKYAGISPTDHLVIASKEVRPADIDVLCGDSSRIRDELGWKPFVGFGQLVGMMVRADMERVC
jgi:GDPmannose 4,6-dehydratase